MRSLASALPICVAIAVALIVGVQVARAGTPEMPEVADPAGDCAVPYGHAYLDILAAWVDTETMDTFDVHLQLASFNRAIAEGAGYTVQFTHQGLQWGIIAVYSSVIADGWQFSTGSLAGGVASGFEDAPGAFDDATSTMVITFAKAIFPHTDMNDTSLRDFSAFSVDLRPAYPFFFGEPAGLDGNGRWVLCDEAVGTLAYQFTGGHGMSHTMGGSSGTELAPAGENATAEAPDEVPLTARSTDKATPLPPALLVGALVLAAVVARSRKR